MRTFLAEVLKGEELTKRELEVLQYTADGYGAKEIVSKMWISEETVKSYKKRIIAKLDANNSVHAVTIAFRTGLIS